jgi:6-phosphogluconate dehydrogenase
VRGIRPHRRTDSRDAVAKDGASAADSLADAVKMLKSPPRAIWLMLPAGEATEERSSS